MNLLNPIQISKWNILTFEFGWFGFRYEAYEANYRNWITTDFEFEFLFFKITGWIP